MVSSHSSSGSGGNSIPEGAAFLLAIYLSTFTQFSSLDLTPVAIGPTRSPSFGKYVYDTLMTTRKPVPLRELSTLAPPNTEHEYFDGYAEHPFVPDAEEFTLVNAWWMAEAALLAYAAPSFAEASWKKLV